MGSPEVNWELPPWSRSRVSAESLSEAPWWGSAPWCPTLPGPWYLQRGQLWSEMLQPLLGALPALQGSGDRSVGCTASEVTAARESAAGRAHYLPELRTCRASGSTSLVAASTATGQVKQEGAKLTLLVCRARNKDLRAWPVNQAECSLAMGLHRSIRAPVHFPGPKTAQTPQLQEWVRLDT